MATTHSVHGSSPRRRGNTRTQPLPRAPTAVHPRAGGEHAMRKQSIAVAAGSSPRRRGTPALRLRPPPCDRFIPAQAGNTYSASSAITPNTVHPRAGGEHVSSVRSSSPTTGSSPRRRGTPRARSDEDERHRFISAQAGNTGTTRTSRIGRSVHPRAGGEHTKAVPARSRYRGSSPRRRGTRALRRLWGAECRFIPAQAGNTPAVPDADT